MPGNVDKLPRAGRSWESTFLVILIDSLNLARDLILIPGHATVDRCPNAWHDNTPGSHEVFKEDCTRLEMMKA